jgi:RNA polymerase sigma-70 factor (ECF subfamily)
MLVEDDEKEENVALNATQFKVIEGTKSDAPSAKASTGQELESLFREHHDRVFRSAYRVTGSVVDAEDVLQTVFLRLSRRTEGINLDPSPASYLHRAAVNAAIDLMRQRARADSIPIDEVAPVLAASARLNPELQSRNSELRATLRRAISKLGEKSAEMFVLKYYEGYDNTEIAKLMGTSAMVVGVLLHRARTRVKKEVGDFLEGGLASL